MNKNFEDIFDSINGLHKKFNSKEYLANMEKFDNDSKELIEILEKYRVRSNSKSVCKRKNEIKSKKVI